jgi:RecB family exonuclease
MAELVARGIPYEARNTDVLCAPEVRDAIALMHAMVEPQDAVSHFRLAAASRFKIDREELRSATSHAKRGIAMETILREIKNGKRLLDALAQARKKIDGLKTGAAGSLDVLIKEFAIPMVDELAVFRGFVRKWQGKPIAEKTTLEAFVEYLDCFISIGGKVMVNADGDEPAEIRNAVQLMTAHAAKGLEFKNVFVIRANSGAFPGNHREALFEFPWELSRSQLSIADIPEPKELHKQEERRLFYVACTRAENSLAVYGKPYRAGGNPTGYVKELLADKTLKDAIKVRRIEQSRIDLQAATAALSPAAEWVLDQPSQLSLGQLRLSASSIECYSQCGLKYWLRYMWKMPEEPAAQLQFGSVVHQVLRGYYEALRAGQKLDLDTVLTAFRDGMENAKLDDQHQLKLYIDQGTRQLTAFVESRKNLATAKVLETEKSFAFELDDIRIEGRMDRVDELSANTVAIEDYKTGKARNEKFAEDSLQLTIYAMAAKREGKTAAEVRIYNLENDSVISVGREEKELQDGEKAIRKAAAGIRDGAFNAKPGFYCRYCAYAAVCPAKEERVFPLTQIATAVQ